MLNDAHVTASAREYSDAERRRQLGGLAGLCSSIAQALREHGETWSASAFEERAQLAQHCRTSGWDQQSLNQVGARFPTGPDWLNPKAVDFGRPREPWQEEVADLHARASRLALAVRATATFD